MVKIWSCKSCSYHREGKGCTKESGCDFPPAMIRLERILTGEYPNHDAPEHPQADEPKTHNKLLKGQV